MGVEIDDVDPEIAYSGSWQTSVGSTRQWGGGTIHSTTQNGASATISFRGTRIILYCTVLKGSGSETVNMNFDGHQSSVTRHSQSSDVYHDNWFDSGQVTDGVHTLVVSNGGGPSDTPFQLDAFHIDGGEAIQPAAAPPPPAQPQPQPAPQQPAQPQPVQPQPAQSQPAQVTTTRIATATVTTTNADGSGSNLSSGLSSVSASSGYRSVSGSSKLTTSASGVFSTMTTTNASGEKTVVTVQYITSAGADGSITTHIVDVPSNSLTSTSHTPVTAIVGGVLGGLLLVILILFFFVMRRRRSAARHVQLGEDTEKQLNTRTRRTTDVTPFQLDANDTSPRYSGTVFSHPHENGFTAKQGLFSAGPATSPTAGSPSRASVLDAGSSSDVSGYLGSTSEKNPELFSNPSPTDESMYIPAPPSGDIHPPRPPEIDAGPYRPRYLSGDTVIAETSTSIYASTMLPPHDTNEFPPSYQR